MLKPNAVPHLEDSVRLLSCVSTKDADHHDAPKTNSKPSAAGSSWKGGAKERNAVLRRSQKGTALKRSGADFAPTWLVTTKSLFLKSVAEQQV